MSLASIARDVWNDASNAEAPNAKPPYNGYHSRSAGDGSTQSLGGSIRASMSAYSLSR
jgi:hypothetical protein